MNSDIFENSKKIHWAIVLICISLTFTVQQTKSKFLKKTITSSILCEIWKKMVSRFSSKSISPLHTQMKRQIMFYTYLNFNL